MRSPPLRWADLGDRRVGVWGVGTEGRATLAALAQLGITPQAVVDDVPPHEGVLATDAGGLEALAACDVVVKAPGISRHGPAVRHLEEAGVAVVGGLGLWLEEVDPESVVAITGTKGKSTTVSVADHLARGLGRRSAAGGNIGTPPWSPDAPRGVDLWIIEVSSYQATDLWSSPAVVGVTSLHEDHLDWHGSVEQYYADKLGLCGRRGARVTVANGEDPELRARAAQLGPATRWVVLDEDAERWTAAIGVRGRHNRRNALLAATCLAEAGVAGADDPARLEPLVRSYEPLPHRLETVAMRGDVEYVDDSLSTNVLPTIAAAEAFAGRPLALLVGGFDRNIDYAPLARFVVGRGAPTLVLTLPQNGARIAAALRDAGGEAVECVDVADAVRRASAWAPPGAVVLLSPAAPSYGVYADYRARAAAFRAAVASLDQT